MRKGEGREDRYGRRRGSRHEAQTGERGRREMGTEGGKEGLGIFREMQSVELVRERLLV